MIRCRHALLALLASTGGSVTAAAGCLDWLFGHRTTVNQPHVAGFAPPATTAAAVPMVTTDPAGQAVAAQMPPNVALPQAAMQPQHMQNPSVLSGMPVNPSAPRVSAFRGATPPVAPSPTAPLGGTTMMPAPQTSFNAAAAFQGQAGAPGTIHPMQVPAAPLPAPRVGLLGILFGNRYRTTYNNVPTTVYRPVQTVDPSTGQRVVVQQPCTTTTQQVQRTPYTALQPAPTPPPHYGGPACGTEGFHAPQRFHSPQAYQPAPSYQGSQTPYSPQAQDAPQPPGVTTTTDSGISQAGASSDPWGGGSQVSPIPSTAPSTQPLRGAPSTPPPSSSYDDRRGGDDPPRRDQPSGDEAEVEQPRLQSSQHSKQQGTAAGRPTHSSSTLPSSTSLRYSDLPPIPASDDYDGPAWNQPQRQETIAPAEQDDPPSRPAISPRSWQDRTAARVQQPQSAPHRDGRTISHGQRQPPPAAAPRRSTAGWKAVD